MLECSATPNTVAEPTSSTHTNKNLGTRADGAALAGQNKTYTRPERHPEGHTCANASRPAVVTAWTIAQPAVGWTAT